MAVYLGTKVDVSEIKFLDIPENMQDLIRDLVEEVEYLREEVDYLRKSLSS